MGKRDKAGPSTSASASGSSPKRARKDEDASAEDDVPTQWEFDFGDEKPNAQELLELAVEEKSEGNSEAAVRLFELALEAFPKEEEEAVKGDKDDVARFLFDWATCLRELGEYLPLRDYLQDAAARLQALAADGTASIAGDVSVSQARTRLALAHLLQETARKQAETLAEEGTEMDKAAEEEQEKMRKDAAEQLKMGSDLYKAAIAAIATKLQGRIASETSIFARYLINFFNVADEEQRQDLLDEALALTQTATSAKPRDDFVLSVRSDALLAAARHLAQQDKTEEALVRCLFSVCHQMLTACFAHRPRPRRPQARSRARSPV